MDSRHHCNDCPYWYVTQKKYPSGFYNITICGKYNKQLYYLTGEENRTPHPCDICSKQFSYVPHIRVENRRKFKMNLEWNIFYYDFNAKEFKVSNVFKHDRYRNDVEELLHKCKNIEDFSDKLQSITMYYFWSKCEWETVIYPWVGDEKAAKKIDVFWQLQNNWSRFVEYLWDMSVKNRNNKNINTEEII